MAGIRRRYLRRFLYLANMPRVPFNPPPEQPHDARGERAAAGQPPAEYYGELAIERHVKDDGRALILYTHRREPPNADGSQ